MSVSEVYAAHQPPASALSRRLASPARVAACPATGEREPQALPGGSRSGSGVPYRRGFRFCGSRGVGGESSPPAGTRARLHFRAGGVTMVVTMTMTTMAENVVVV